MKLARWVAFLVWAAVAASAVFWALRLFVRPLAVPPHAQVAVASVPRADLTRLFGVDVAPPPAPVQAVAAPAASTRFQLVGVAAPRGERGRTQGVALIAIDGKPARAFGVGAVVDGEQILQAVQQRGATIGPRGGVASVKLELPPVPPPSSGAPAPAPALGLPGVAAVPPAPASPRATPALPFGSPPPRLRGFQQGAPTSPMPAPFGIPMPQMAPNPSEADAAAGQGGATSPQR